MNPADIQRVESALELALANPLLATCSAAPEPRPLTIADIRHAMAELGFPRPETAGERALRHLREMGFEIRVVDPEPIFTICLA